jgi:glycosyltransferase involved in cell wall biosynthesis
MRRVLSYIIPIFNAENTIIKLLDSICRRTDANDDSDYEVICVDDGSTDCSNLLIEQYIVNNPQVRLLYQENRGVSAARNRGINEAKGEWLTFADSDDEYSSRYNLKDIPENINLAVYGFNEKMSETDYIVFSPDVSSIYTTKEYIEKFAKIDKILFINSCCNKIYKTDMVRKAGLFDEDISLGEDAIFNYRYLMFCSKVSVMSDQCYIYNNFGKGSLTRRDTSVEELWNCYFMISSGLEQICNQLGCPKIADNIFCNYYMGTINAYTKMSGIKEQDTRAILSLLKNNSWKDKLDYQMVEGVFNKKVIQFLKTGHILITFLLIEFQRVRRHIKRVLKK